MNVHFKILRFDPERDAKPHFAEYDVAMEPSDRVLDGLNHIKWYLDGSLTYRRSCEHGVCGSDAMLINSRNRLACKLLIKDTGSKVLVEPLRGYKVVKDLVVDLTSFFESYRAMKPYLQNDEAVPVGERLQTPAERARYDDTTKCILCAACTTSCPPFWANSEFVGPASIVNAHRFIFDSRDRATEERLLILNQREGVWRCRTVFNCTEACPRGIEITKAIEEVKRAILLKGV
jgi:succinate dehydrogenase / fumarate reductase iron-sulfur subunit